MAEIPGNLMPLYFTLQTKPIDINLLKARALEREANIWILRGATRPQIPFRRACNLWGVAFGRRRMSECLVTWMVCISEPKYI
jgi:hypothetical protein